MIGHLNKYDQAREICRIFSLLLQSDKKFLWLSIIYGVSISVLTLAVPVAVQLLINSVSYTASTEAVIILAFLLLFFLLCSGFLTCIQSYIMELFERSIYARLSAEITLHTLFTDYRYSERANKADFVNRYFDIMTLQKLVPNLIVGFLALGLQTLVGIVLVSSYHPILMIFNAVFLFLLWIIWRIWGYDAISSSIMMSDAKYVTARHIEDIAHAPSFYASQSHTNYAIKKADHLIGEYIQKRRTYFRQSFTQQICLVLIYALASAILLGLGGILVIYQELTLGQLVSSELVLSSVFYSISKSSYLLTQVYELGAAIEEIYRVFQMPLESPSQGVRPTEKYLPVHFENASFIDDENKLVTVDFVINPNEKVIVECEHHDMQTLILHAIQGHIPLKSGHIMIGEYDLRDMHIRHIRDRIIVLDQPSIIECTIREYMKIRNNDVTTSEIYNILDIVELTPIIHELDDHLETKLAYSGMPLTIDQLLRMKLATALLSEPIMIIMNQFYDVIDDELYQRIFTKIQKQFNCSVLYFSHRPFNNLFDRTLYLKNMNNGTQ